METFHNIIEYCREQTLFFFYEVKKTKEKSNLKHQNFYSLILNLVEKINDVYLDLFDKTSDKKINDILLEAYTNKAKLYFYIIRVLHAYLEIIRPEREANIPVEFTLIIEKLITKLFKKNLMFLVAEWDINYTFRNMTDGLRDLFQEEANIFPDLLEILNEFEYEIIIISFPLPWKEIALLHSLIYHEIGHLLREKIKFDIKKEVVEVIDESIIDRYVEKIRSQLSDNTSSSKDLMAFLSEVSIKNTLIQNTRAILTGWIEEILCDLFGVFLLKFGYIFAFVATLGTKKDPFEASIGHPPDFIRFQFMFKALEKIGLTDELKTISQNIYDLLDKTTTEEKWNEFMSHLRTFSTDFINEYEICIECLMKIQDKTINTELFDIENIHFLKFNYEDFTTKQPHLFPRLTNFVPINEYLHNKKFITCELPLIINTGWIYYYKKNEFNKFKSFVKKSVKTPLKTSSSFFVLNQLIYKSIQLSFIQGHLSEIQEDMTWQAYQNKM